MYFWGIQELYIISEGSTRPNELHADNYRNKTMQMSASTLCFGQPKVKARGTPSEQGTAAMRKCRSCVLTKWGNNMASY
jgi:hypothetical protein